MTIKGKIPQTVIDEIRDRMAIERVVGEYVPLKRAGRNFKGSCPFHQEKTPSFTVNTERQIFKCFGCGASGNVFTFLMMIEHITFFEALERLASQAGVSLPDVPRETAEHRGEKENLLEIMKRAWKLYSDCLLRDPASSSARDYLEKRGFSVRDINRYGLGYAPDQWDFLVKKLNAPASMLLRAGLVAEKSDQQRIYDRFRNRIIIPIRDHRSGSIVAFGGRTLGHDPAKYINSPESPIYNKSQILYGLYEAQKAIRQTRDVLVVEGYFDRMAVDKAGISHCVAPCGTSLTQMQLKLVKRYAQSVYFIFDSDSAGISAACRALESALSAGIEARAVPLPDGLDPDDVIRRDGIEGFRSLLAQSVQAIDFLIRTASRRHDLSIASGRRTIVEEMLPFLTDIENAIDRGTCIARIADLVHVPSDSVLELLKRYRIRRIRTESARSGSTISHPTVTPLLDSRERDLFFFFIQNPDYLLWEENPLTPDHMMTKLGREVYSMLQSDMESYGSFAVARMLDDTTSTSVRSALIDLFDDPEIRHRLIDDDPAVIFQSLIEGFEERALRNEISQIMQNLGKPGISDAETESLLRRHVEILNLLDKQKMP
ncbi:DNA primase [bacterium]|nr:DNA primase [candidate division CSSED10-310 bacterium]